MKLISLAGLFILLFFQTSCGSGNITNHPKYKGIIEPAGVTTYQYGSLILNTKNDFYALKSDQFDLKKYEGLKVSITASKIEGYPLEGGPVFLKVESIREQ